MAGQKGKPNQNSQNVGNHCSVERQKGVLSADSPEKVALKPFGKPFAVSASLKSCQQSSTNASPMQVGKSDNRRKRSNERTTPTRNIQNISVTQDHRCLYLQWRLQALG